MVTKRNAARQSQTDPLTWNIPLVDPQTGMPTPEFQRKWLRQQHVNSYVPSVVSASSAALDLIGNVPGDILQRGTTAWGVLLPPNNATFFFNGSIPGAFAQVKDSDLNVTDIVTNNVSITAHGFAPKAPNDATKYLDGTGNYSVPAGGSGSAPASIQIQTNSDEYIAISDANGLLVLDGSGFPVWVANPVKNLYTVANLPAAGNKGRRATVSDSNQTTTAGIGTIVAAGGANTNPVYDDGTNWRIG